jgi:hypothetical protein
MRAES